MRNTPPPLQRGFTLIELALVAIVLALIAVLLLYGRDLIITAEYRRQVTQMEMVNAAVAQFQSRFSSLPADSQFATDYNIDGPGGNGNGDGVVSAAEAPGFYFQLARAGIISDTGYTGAGWQIGATFLAAELRNMGYLVTGVTNRGDANYGNWMWLTTTAPLSACGQSFCGGAQVEPLIYIDNKMDDGMPTTGMIRLFVGNSSGNNPFTMDAHPGDSSGVYVPTLNYDATYTGNDLAIGYKVSW